MIGGAFLFRFLPFSGYAFYAKLRVLVHYELPKPVKKPGWQKKGLRDQVRFQEQDTDTAVLTVWLDSFGCTRTSVCKSVLGTFERI